MMQVAHEPLQSGAEGQWCGARANERIGTFWRKDIQKEIYQEETV
jgi:hypothetical protein